ncbi:MULTISPECIES: hypothetical protein [unclassified Serratia (in: enterobacteria)]|uniref:hypothetical protein n=1 Tax=unclassified Serratia (in: enterobacteria) TaxID=2647522 RepID=UPI002ED329C4|nr:hypothetical protein [Serratia sp. C2(2)]MEE4448352.1 hypothetical protein [Serratia sp. C2(1)]
MKKLSLSFLLLTLVAGSSYANDDGFRLKVSNNNKCDVKVVLGAPESDEVLIKSGKDFDQVVKAQNTAIYPAQSLTNDQCHFDQTLELTVEGDSAELISSNWDGKLKPLYISGGLGGVPYIFDKTVTGGTKNAIGVLNRSFSKSAEASDVREVIISVDSARPGFMSLN